MRSNQFTLEVLIKGRPIKEFLHEEQHFVEGRPGSEFELVFNNLTPNRVMAVISVDGLSVTDGKLAGPESPGYIVHPFGQIVIPGWKIDNGTAAKFTFGSRVNSYAQAATSTSTNCGVIGVMVWSEKPIQPKQFVRPTIIPRGCSDSTVYGGPLSDGYLSKGLTGNVGSFSSSGGTSFHAAAPTGGDMFPSYASNSSLESAAAEKKLLGTAQTSSVNNLGTGFGKATEFNTSSAVFNKDAVISTMVLYYDDARGLKARGIVLERTPKPRYSANPNPFPAIGCTPPKGWTGK